MQYREFFDIEIVHPSFSSISKDLVIVAENETKNHLNNHSFILKKTTNGIKVLAPVDQEGNSFKSLGEQDIFTFYIYPISEDIQEVTDFSEIEKGNMISFTNRESQIGSSELIATQIEQNGVFCGFPALASIVIDGSKINVNSVDQSTKFKIIFKAKSIKWKYYFVSNFQESSITLESRNKQISFHEIAINENTTDQIVTSIRLNFPNTQIKVFESRNSIPYSSKPIKNIKLLQNSDVLISHLPNPKKEQRGIQIIKIK